MNKIKIIVANSPSQLMDVTNSWLEREGKIKEIISLQYSTVVKSMEENSMFNKDYNNIEYSVCMHYKED